MIIEEKKKNAVKIYFTVTNKTLITSGGVLINEYYVLTAAHAIVDVYPVVAVIFCEWDTLDDYDCVRDNKTIGTAYVKIEVHETFYHPRYVSGRVAYDIALIRLKKPAPIGDSIRPICLPDPETPIDVRLTALGWGKIDERYMNYSRYLKKVDLPLVDMKHCDELFCKQGMHVSEDSQICAGGEMNKDTCQGDSGGPLMQRDDYDRWIVVGITSYGVDNCGLTSEPSVYTKVGYFRNDILATLKP